MSDGSNFADFLNLLNFWGVGVAGKFDPPSLDVAA